MQAKVVHEAKYMQQQQLRCFPTLRAMGTTKTAVVLVLQLAVLVLLPVRGIADYVLFSGEVLMAGQNLTNGQFRLAMQTDCDLVVYDGDDNPIWTADVAGQGHDCYLMLKDTAELVVRSGIHYTLWTSNSRRTKNGEHALVLDGSGNLGIYSQRLWSSRSRNGNAEPDDPSGDGDDAANYVLFSGQLLTPGKKLKYGRYELKLMDCNMVIEDVPSGKLLWQTNTRQSNKGSSCYTQLQDDGNLIVRHEHEQLWSSNEKDESGAYMAVLQFDGRLSVYGPMIWYNNKRRGVNTLSSV